nr:hypothetical protein [Bacteroidales bacterium]
SIIFNGRAHYAKRDAMLEVVNNQLVVSNLSHPADGVIIDTAGVSGLKLDFLPHTLAQGEVLGATLNMRDGLDRMKSVAQWALCPDSSGNYACLVVNSHLEGENIQVVGMKNGDMVLCQNFINQPDDPYSNWIVIALIVIGVSTIVVSGSSHKKTVEKTRDNQGNVVQTKVKTTKSVGLSGTVVPLMNSHASITPELSNSSIEVDELHIVSSRTYPGEIPTELDGDIEEVVMTANFQSGLTITNETEVVTDVL